jgi:dipeptidyl aminopeptidase/acylaminoacyl peptidase
MKILCLLLSSALFAGAAAAASPPQGFADDAAAFGALETVYSAALSADGKKIVYVGPGTGASTIAVVIHLDTGAIAQVARGDGKPINIRNCEWTATDRIVCSLWGLQRYQGVLVPLRRTLSMDADGKNQVFLGQKDTLEQVGKRFGDGRVVDWLSGTDGLVLMARSYVPESTTGRLVGRTLEGLGVDRVDTRTGKATMVERPGDDVTNYISDGMGNIRIMTTVKVSESGLLKGVKVYSYRTTDDRAWRQLGTFVQDREHGGPGTGMLPLAVDPTLNAAYVLENLEGRMALYRVTLDAALERELVLANPSVDVDGVVTIGRGGRVIGATYATERRYVEYFDPEYKKLHDMLERALPKSPLISFESSSADENFLIVRASSDLDPGKWYLYDKARKTLGVITPARPPLEGRTLSAVKPIAYAAADGTQVPGYLTLPPGVTDPKNLPAIVLPHGGPGARDEWGFDWLPQFFAQRGYVVLQPNFRGSTGFGDAWYANNGIRGWKTSVGDVCDAGRWLVSQGIADPRKLAIVGWSYGGYAALQANVLDPDLFKAVVAIAPVTDFALLKSKEMQYIDAFLTADFIGSGPHIKEGSPAQNAQVFKAPVIMFQGDNDLNVDIGQSRLMDRELHRAGKSSELTVYPDLDHSLSDGTVRADMLRKSDAFLRAQLKL